jgi:nucleotide-binding universal stress UspA family protein
MPTYKHLLLATDFSEASTHASELAARIAERLGAMVTIAHVYDSTPFHLGHALPPQQLAEGLSASAATRLDDVRKEHFPAASNVRTLAIDAESAAAAVSEQARGSGVDLVVVGTRGRSGLARLLIGSVADSIVRLSPCDVLTVPPGSNTTELPRTVLAPTDFSEAAGVAVGRAHALATALDAELTVAHVFDPSVPIPAPNEAAGLWLPQDQVEAELRGKLDMLHETELGKSPRVRTELIVADSHAEGIVAYAEDQGMGMIVVGSFGLGALERFLIGSVAERVVRAAHCPVLTVRSRKR